MFLRILFICVTHFNFFFIGFFVFFFYFYLTEILNSSVCLVNFDLYLFGGLVDGNSINNIYQINCIDETSTVLDIKLPDGLSNMESIYIPKNKCIVLFGGVDIKKYKQIKYSKSIYIFNTCNKNIVKSIKTLEYPSVRFKLLYDSKSDSIYSIGGVIKSEEGTKMFNKNNNIATNSLQQFELNDLLNNNNTNNNNNNKNNYWYFKL